MVELMIFSDTYHIHIGHFCPWNSWHEDASRGVRTSSSCLGVEVLPKFVVDETTGDRYLNDPDWLIRAKCTLVALYSLPTHLIAGVINLGCIAKEIVCGQGDVAHNLTRLALTPIIYVGLVLSAVYGIINPLDGRKLYATCERFWYHGSVLAECFQPSHDGYQRVSSLPLTCFKSC